MKITFTMSNTENKKVEQTTLKNENSFRKNFMKSILRDGVDIFSDITKNISFKDSSDELFDLSYIDPYLFDESSLSTIGEVYEDGKQVPEKSRIIFHFQSLITLICTLQGCSNMLAISSAILSYVQSHYKGCLLEDLVDYISRNVVHVNLSQYGQIYDTQAFSDGNRNNEFHHQDHSLDKEDVADLPNWLDSLKKLAGDWYGFQECRLFKELSKLFGILSVLKLCDISDVTIKICDFVLFQPDITNIHENAHSLIESIFSTVIYFTENIYECFKEGSIKPFLLNDKTASEIDEEIATIESYWKLFQQGNLENHGIKESEFVERLESITSRVRFIIRKTRSKSFYIKLLQDKFDRLLCINNDYTTFVINASIREAPFALELFGPSNRGKTTCGDQIIDSLLASQGESLDRKYRASYNANDKFMSTWTSEKTVLIIDDMANAKANYVEKPPTQVLIDVVNNNPYDAPVAELDRKGKVAVKPKICMITTNQKDLDAYTYSNCPYSIQRRPNYVITVDIKKEYAAYSGIGQCKKIIGIDKAKVLKEIQDSDLPFDDIWELTVEIAVEPDTLSSKAPYAVVYDGDIKLEKVSMKVLLPFLIKQFDTHRKQQRIIIDRMKGRSSKLNLCPVEGCCQLRGLCPDHMSKQSGTLASGVLGNLSSALNRDLFGRDTNLASVALISLASAYCKEIDFLKFIPTPIMTNKYFISSLIGLRFSDIIYYKKIFVIVMIVINFGVYNYFYNFCISCVVLLMCLVLYKYIMFIIVMFIRSYLVRRNVVSASIQSWRDRYGIQIAASCSLLYGLYRLCKFMKPYNEILSKQGNLQPMSADDIFVRDSQKNIWNEGYCKVIKRSLPYTYKSKTTSHKDLIQVVDKNLYFASVTNGKSILKANCLFIKTNFLLIPNHYFDIGDELEMELTHHRPDGGGAKFKVQVSKSSSYTIPNSDVALSYVPSCGSMKNIVDFFPTKSINSMCEFSLAYRDVNGDLRVAKGTSEFLEYAATEAGKFLDLGKYVNINCKTFKGLCGATIISHEPKGTCIYGMHIGGVDGKSIGIFSNLNNEKLHIGINNLEKNVGIISIGDNSDFPMQQYDKQTLLEGATHYKSPICYLPKDTTISYHGLCIGQSTSYSEVESTTINPFISKYFDIEDIWGKPKFRPDYYAYQKCLENMSHTGSMFKYDILRRAVQDYKIALKVFKRDYIGVISPLTNECNINGMDGIRFIDPIKMDTAIGYPLTGKKKQYTFEYVNDVGKICKDFNSDIWLEINRCEELYSRGERAYTIAKASKKDEVVVKDKNKCRVFFGNPISLTFLIRKYYLPLIRIMQLHPLEFECAVGVNCYGPEWDQLYKHAIKFGSDRLIGGDYSKYDQRMPSQSIITALSILIDMAKMCNYSDKDITIMKSMVSDIVFSIVAVNGDLVQLHTGGHISGNSLTVIINSIVGSLNMRCAFYDKYGKDSHLKFRDYISLLTYGDDNIGSVSKLLDFNIIDVSDYLARHGQTYTMPDKDSELQPFIENFEFLKRTSVYCPKKKHYIGALSEDSIYKMLMKCLNRDNELLPHQQSAINVKTALMEWSNHGELIYNDRRKTLINAVMDYDECNTEFAIMHLCGHDLNITYDERVTKWLDDYKEDL